CAMNPDDYKARVTFRETTQGYTFQLYALCKDSGFAYSGTIFPGTYAVSVYGGHYQGYSNLPFQDYIVEDALAVAANLAAKALDVKTLDIGGRITLNGAPPQVGPDCAMSP